MIPRIVFWAMFAGLQLCCGAPSPPASHLPPPSSTAVAAPSATASAAPQPSEAAKPDADPMWRVIANRVVFSRSSDHGPTCERLRIVPDFPPGGHTGAAVLESEDSGGVSFVFQYQGETPRLSSPSAQIGDHSMPLTCKGEDRGAWFATLEACRDPAAEPILEPVGCLSALSGSVRQRAVQSLTGQLRVALRARLKPRARLWSGDCTPRLVRSMPTTKIVGFSGLPDRGQPDEVYVLYGRGYPVAVGDAPHGGVILGETTLPNIFRPQLPAGEGAAIACCGSTPYSIVDVSDSGATLRSRETQSEEHWYWSEQSCRSASAAATGAGPRPEGAAQ